MSGNYNKYAALSLSGQPQPTEHAYSINDEVILRPSYLADLALTISSNLSFEQHAITSPLVLTTHLRSLSGSSV